jgi:hypothetical protein
MLADPIVPTVLLQQLASLAMLLHEEHISLIGAAEQQEQQQQQQQQQQPAMSGQSNSSSQQADPGPPSKQRFRADLLDVRAFHLNLQQQLPDLASKAYWDAARSHWARAHEKWLLCSQRARQLVCAANILINYSDWIQAGSSQQQSELWQDWLISVEVTKIVLELQLLAAAFVQRQRRQGAVLHSGHAGELLVNSNSLLQDLILGFMQRGSPCLPPILLEQCGLQLLQALAAPVQQLLLQPDDIVAEHLLQLTESGGGQQQQLYVLRVAVSGCGVAHCDDPDFICNGEFQTLKYCWDIAP